MYCDHCDHTPCHTHMNITLYKVPHALWFPGLQSRYSVKKYLDLWGRFPLIPPVESPPSPLWYWTLRGGEHPAW